MTNQTESTTVGVSDVVFPMPGDQEAFEDFGINIQVFLILVYSLTALVALLGNATVIIVLIRGKRSSRELRVFLVNLAVSDVTMSIFSIPFTYTDIMLGRWIFAPSFCPVVLFMQHCSVIVSVYTLTVVGIDRYYAILYPLNSRWTKSRGPLVILAVWVMAVGISSVQFIYGKATKRIVNLEEVYTCDEDWGVVEGKVYTAAIFTITFLLPLLVLMFTYTSIGWRLWTHTAPGNQHSFRDDQQFKYKLKVVKMLSMVVVLFAVCWFPIHVFSLLVYYDPHFTEVETVTEYYVFHVIFFLCHWLAMANSCVNPVIYCLMSDTFKADLRQVCCRCSSASSGGASALSNRGSNSSSFRTTTLNSLVPAKGSNKSCGKTSSVRKTNAYEQEMGTAV